MMTLTMMTTMVFQVVKLQISFWTRIIVLSLLGFVMIFISNKNIETNGSSSHSSSSWSNILAVTAFSSSSSSPLSSLKSTNNHSIRRSHRRPFLNNVVLNVVVNNNSPYDRFIAECPATRKMVEGSNSPGGEDDINDNENNNDNDDDEEVWVAVYRSNQNQPSVLVRDEFLQAMNDATLLTTTTKDTAVSGSPTQQQQRTSSFVPSTPSLLLNTQKKSQQQRPVAMARMRRVVTANNNNNNNNDDNNNNNNNNNNKNGCFLLDSIQCSLKKENMEQDCDGGSEYLEAVGVAIDELLLNHLQKVQQAQTQQQQQEQQDQEQQLFVFEGTIRVKATLFSAKAFEDRGFIPIESFSKDMATHVSSYEHCLDRYAQRVASVVGPTIGTTTATSSLGLAARDRALQIVSMLGRLDREAQQQQQGGNNNNSNDVDDDEYDPWANINLRR